MKLKLWEGDSFPIFLCLGYSQEATQSKKECVSTKLMAEQEVVLFRQQLLALRQALARAQAHNVRMCEQQESQVSEPGARSAKQNVAPGSRWCCLWQSPGLLGVKPSSRRGQRKMARVLASLLPPFQPRNQAQWPKGFRSYSYLA